MNYYKDIPGYEHIYQITKKGKIKALERVVIARNGTPTTIHQSIKKQKVGVGGYFTVQLAGSLHKKRIRVADLVALTYLGVCPDGQQVIFKDRQVKNHQLDNLHYDLPRNENLPMKSNHPGKLSNQIIYRILDKRQEGSSLRDVAAEFSISVATVSSIINAKTWKPAFNTWTKLNGKLPSGGKSLDCPLLILLTKLAFAVQATQPKKLSIRRPVAGYSGLYEINTRGSVYMTEIAGQQKMVMLKHRYDDNNPERYVVLLRPDGRKFYPTIITLLQETFGDLL